MLRSSVAAFASTAPCPSLATMANAPLAEQVGGSCAFDLPDAATEIFLREGLDRLLVICPSGYFVARIACNWVLSTNPTLALQLRRRGAPDPFQYDARYWVESMCHLPDLGV